MNYRLVKFSDFLKQVLLVDESDIIVFLFMISISAGCKVISLPILTWTPHNKLEIPNIAE